MNTVLLLLIAAVIGLLVYIRLAPTDPGRWHVDPLLAADPGQAGVLIVPPSAPVYACEPATLLMAFDRVVSQVPRTRQIARDNDAPWVTYEARTKWVGFPDYISVRAVEVEGGASLAILSRLRFGRSDLGVNAKRAQAIIAALDAELETSDCAQ